MADGAQDGSGRYRGPAKAAPYALSRLSGPVSLVEVAREIEQADQWLASTASAKLGVIAEQMLALRDKAQRVLEKAQRDAELHRAEARFKRYPGRTYHLYARAPGNHYWSLLSPAEWNGAPPHPFVGSYRLEADQSFTALHEDGSDADDQGSDLAARLKQRLLRGDLP
jgi:hypothetical protein